MRGSKIKLISDIGNIIKLCTGTVPDGYGRYKQGNRKGFTGPV